MNLWTEVYAAIASVTEGLDFMSSFSLFQLLYHFILDQLLSLSLYNQIYVFQSDLRTGYFPKIALLKL